MELFDAPKTTLWKLKLYSFFARRLRRPVEVVVIDRDTGVVLRAFRDIAIKSSLRGSHGLVPGIILLKSKKAMFGEMPPQQNLIFLTDTYSGKFITKADLKKEKLDATLSTEEKRIGFDMIRYISTAYSNNKGLTTILTAGMLIIFLLFSMVITYYQHKNIQSEGAILKELKLLMEDSIKVRTQEIQLLKVIAKAEGINVEEIEDIEAQNATAPQI